MQAKIIKSSLLAAWKTLFSGIVKLFCEFEGGHLEQGCKMREEWGKFAIFSQ